MWYNQMSCYTHSYVLLKFAIDNFFDSVVMQSKNDVLFPLKLAMML